MKSKWISSIVFIAFTMTAALSAATTSVTDQTFDSAIATGVVVVDFYADWCGPCKKFGPTFSEVSDQVNDVKFVKANIDQVKTAANKYNVSSIPTVVLFRDGKEVKRNVGGLDANGLKQFVQSSN